MSYSHRRVVITGLGLVSPLGNTPDELWRRLSAGQSAVAPFSHIHVTGRDRLFGAEAHEFTGAIDNFGPLEADKKKAIRKGLKLMCRETQMGVASGQIALADAGWGAGGFDVERSGVTFGSDYMVTDAEDFLTGIRLCSNGGGTFDFSRWGTEGLKEVTPLWLLKYLPNMPASHLAIYNDLRGPSNSVTIREASSNLAIGEAYRTIARGDAEIMLAGSTGTRVQPTRLIHTLMQEQVACWDGEPDTASRPFDKNRYGQVVGEGSGAVVLEELEFAQQRGAKIYGEMLGFGSSAAATRQGVADRKQALANSIKAALTDAKLEPQAIGHIHAHGLSTTQSDIDEAQAIVAALADAARRMPVVAAKSYFGNLGAGSGAVELIASVMAMQAGKLFATRNYQTADPDCPISVCTDADIPAGNCVLNLSTTPQGQASALIVGKFAG
jgi:3-oxoacyl-[acyl-carrier-protein] synthase II